MTDSWEQLDDFLAHMDYWVSVQEVLSERSSTVPLFGPPYLFGDRLTIAADERRQQHLGDSQGDYSVTHEDGFYDLKYSGGSRSHIYDDLILARFSTFQLCGKYFLSERQAGPTRVCKSIPVRLPFVEIEWSQRGIAPGWTASTSPLLTPSGTHYTRFTRSDSVDQYFLAGQSESVATFPLSMTWYEISKTFSEGIPGIENIRIPEALE